VLLIAKLKLVVFISFSILTMVNVKLSKHKTNALEIEYTHSTMTSIQFSHQLTLSKTTIGANLTYLCLLLKATIHTTNLIRESYGLFHFSLSL
jgi:hypothetical protein